MDVEILKLETAFLGSMPTIAAMCIVEIERNVTVTATLRQELVPQECLPHRVFHRTLKYPVNSIDKNVSDPGPYQQFTCTECGLLTDSATTPTIYAYTCGAGCVGCFEQSDRCFLFGQQYNFAETATSETYCAQFIDTEDVLCVHVAYGAFTRLDDGTKRPSVSNCSSQWKGEDCQCTICGFDDDLGVPLGRHDCSAVAEEASVYDECTQTYTGVFSVYNENKMTYVAEKRDPNNILGSLRQSKVTAVVGL